MRSWSAFLARDKVLQPIWKGHAVATLQLFSCREELSDYVILVTVSPVLIKWAFVSAMRKYEIL